jgi:hypothetical protein
MYEHKVKDTVFKFRKPKLNDLDRYFKQASKMALVTAGVMLTQDLIDKAQSDAWNEVIKNKPGHAQTVAGIVLQGEGFGDDTEDEDNPKG